MLRYFADLFLVKKKSFSYGSSAAQPLKYARPMAYRHLQYKVPIMFSWFAEKLLERRARAAVLLSLHQHQIGSVTVCRVR